MHYPSPRFSLKPVYPGSFQCRSGRCRRRGFLVEHPQINKISPTGSTEAGRAVMSRASHGLEKVSLELGVKITHLLSLLIATSTMLFQQQSWLTLYPGRDLLKWYSRVFVESKLREVFIEKLLKRVKKLTLGDPLHPSTHVGALISRDHAERVRGYIRLGETEGARLVCGGAGIPELAPSPNKLDVEAFVLPTVFTECQDDMTIVQDEIFGPVMSVLISKRKMRLYRVQMIPTLV